MEREKHRLLQGCGYAPGCEEGSRTVTLCNGTVRVRASGGGFEAC